MPGDREGFVVRRIIPGAPVLLAFDGTDGPGAGFEDAEAWEDVARRGDGPVGLILLRDPAAAGYYRGIPGLGDSIGEAADALRAMIDGSGTAGVVTSGAGLGGHAALVFGTLLGAARVVAVEPVAHLIAEELASYNDRRWGRVLAALPQPSPARWFDVPTLMGRRGFAGEALVILGTGRGDSDLQSVHPCQVHAHWLARSDRVTLLPVPEVLPGRWRELLRHGDLEAVMARHLFDAGAPPNGEGSDPAAPAVRRPAAGRCIVSLIQDTSDDGSEVVYAVAGDGEVPEPRPIDDEMRRWIAENLLIGEPPDSIAGAMRRIGFTEAVARDEIRRAGESPYVRGAALLQNRMRKRDWLLSAYRKLGRLRPGSGGVERRPRLGRDELLREYYTANRPAIITGMMRDPPSPARWSLDQLERRFGDRQVLIRRAWTARDRDAPEDVSRLASLAEYVGMIRDGSNEFCLTTEDPLNREALGGLWDEIGRVPEYLRDEGRLDGWFRLDPPGSFRTFRHELSNLLVAPLLGTIRMKLVPSWDLPLMRNATRVYSQVDGRRIAESLPIDQGPPQVLECALGPGELLFLPVGWWSFFEWTEASAVATGDAFVFDNDFASPDASPDRV